MILSSEYYLKTDNSNLPLTTAEVNDHLKESFTDISSEELIPIFIKAVEYFGEQFTKRVFLTKTFTNYRRCWESTYELRKSKLGVINSVKYYDTDDSLQTIDSSNYLTSNSEEFSSLYFIETYSYPSLSSNIRQPIQIEFTAGYGTTESSIPNNIKTAMLNHLALLWKNRGDCMSQGSAFDTKYLERFLPKSTLLIYSMERIKDIII